MADRQFDIEVLIKARNAASAVLKDFAKDVKSGEGNLEKFNSKAKDANKTIEDLGKKAGTARDGLKNLSGNLKDVNKQAETTGSKLGTLNERFKDFSKETLTAGGRMKSFNDGMKDLNKTQQNYRSSLSSTVESQKQFNTQLRSLKGDLESLGKAVRFAMGDTSDYVQKTADARKATESADRAVRSHEGSVRRLRSAYADSGNVFGRFSQELLGVSSSSRKADTYLNDLYKHARGLGIALAVKYAQALVSGLEALGGEALSVAGSMVSAGAAIGGAFTAGVAQAIPAVGLLTAALSRLNAIRNITNLKQTIDQNSNHTARTGGNKDQTELNAQRTALEGIKDANDSLINAQEGVADSNRNLAQAQRELNLARKDARRELEDLIAAERDAKLAAEGATLSQEEAQRALLAATAGGDVDAIRNARLGLANANNNVTSTQLAASRAASDAAEARRKGVSGSDRVLNAQNSVTDAQQQQARAARELANAQRGVSDAHIKLAQANKKSADATADNTAQQDRLNYMLSQLSPAERKLYNDLENLRSVYKKAFRPVTDEIIQAFDYAVQQVTKLFGDEKLIGGFKKLAATMGDQIKRVTDFTVSPRSLSFFDVILKDSNNSLPKITTGIINLSKAFQNIAISARPVLDYILKRFDDLTGDFFHTTENSKRLDTFFEGAKKDLMALGDLVGAIGRVLGAVFEPARQQGRKDIEDLARTVDGFATKLSTNQGGVKKFLAESSTAVHAMAGVVGEIFHQLGRIFSPSNVINFAEVLRTIVIPAIGNVISVMGTITQEFHKLILSFNISREAAQFILTLLLITKGISVLRGAIAEITLTLNGLFGGGAGAGRFGAYGRAVVIFGAIITTFGGQFGRTMDNVLHAAETALGAGGLILLLNRNSSAFKAFRTTLALQTAGLGGVFGKVGLNAQAGTGVAISALGGLATKAKAILAGLRAAFLTNPFGILVTGIGLAVTAFNIFGHHQDQTKIKIQDTTDAINRQIDAMRALRDQSLNVKDAQIGLQRAQLDAKDATQSRIDIEKKAGKDGKITPQEQRDITRARLDEKQAILDIARARNTLNDTKKDGSRVDQEAAKSSKDVIDKQRENVKGYAEQIDENNRHIQKLRDEIDEYKRVNGSYAQTATGQKVIKGYQQQINDLTDKNKDLTKKMAGAQDNLNDSLRRAAGGFQKLGGNAEDFGLTYSDVIQYVQKSSNRALAAFGADPINFSLEFQPNSHHNNASPTGPFGDGTLHRAGGGWIPGDGLYDTVPVMAAPGEAILNRHQTPIVDAALRASGMWGGLGDLFSSVQTPHWMASGGFVGGLKKFAYGGVIPPLAKLITKLDSMGFRHGATTNHSKYTSSGNISNHYRGEAVDYGDATNDMRKLWATVYPMRAKLAELFGPAYLSPKPTLMHNGVGFVDPGLQAEHNDHIHIALTGAIGKIVTGMAESVKKVKIKGGPGGSYVTKIVQAASNKMVRQANKFLAKQQNKMAQSATGNIMFGSVPGHGGDSDQNRTIGRRLMLAAGFSADQWPFLNRLWTQESGWSQYADTRKTGLDPANASVYAYGIPQARPATKMASYGKDYMTNPITQIKWGLNYIKGRYGTPAAAWAHEVASGFYSKGGKVKPRRYDSGGYVGSAPATNRGYGFGATPPRTINLNTNSKFADQLKNFNKVLGDITDSIKGTDVKAKKFAKSLSDLTASDNGAIALLVEQVQNVIGVLQGKGLRSKFKVNNKGDIKVTQDDVETAAKTVSTLFDQLDIYLGLRKKLNESEKVARKALKDAKTKSQRQDARAALRAIQGAQVSNETNISQAASDITDARASLNQARLDRLNNRFANRFSNLDLRDARRAAAGQPQDFDSRTDLLVGQINGLQNYLRTTKRLSPAAKQQIQQQINGLQSDLISNLTASTQAAIDGINKNSDKRLAAADRTGRLGNVIAGLREGNFLSGAVGARDSAAATLSSNQTLYNQLAFARQIAVSRGQLGIVDDLDEQMKDLATTIQENTLAVQQNNDAITQSRIDRIINQSGFSTGIFGSAVSFLQAFAENTGSNQNGGIASLLGLSNTSLTNANSGLEGILDPILQALGLGPTSGLNGKSLVDYIVSISGANLDNLTPEQANQFRNLTAALIQNTTTIETNNKQIQDLTNNISQSFSSTSWQLFRKAVFDGAGGLLPEFSQYVPHMASGGNITKEGMFYLHAGEKVTPKNDVSSSGKEEHNWYVTSPTEVADPDYFASVFSFRRSTKKAN